MSSVFNPGAFKPPKIESEDISLDKSIYEQNLSMIKKIDEYVSTSNEPSNFVPVLSVLEDLMNQAEPFYDESFRDITNSRVSLFKKIDDDNLISKVVNYSKASSNLLNNEE